MCMSKENKSDNGKGSKNEKAVADLKEAKKNAINTVHNLLVLIGF